MELFQAIMIFFKKLSPKKLTIKHKYYIGQR